MRHRVILWRIPLVCIALAAAALPLSAATKPAAKPALTPTPAVKIDPQATQMLRQMTNYPTSLNQFTVHVDSTMEAITSSGQVLNSDKSMDISVMRPDHLRVDSHVPDHDRQFYYDGKTLTIYSPKQNVYAVIDAPPTIDGLVELARQRGMQLPLADLIVSNPYPALMKDTLSAVYVGQSLVGNTMTNQLAFQRKGLEWQIWIEDGPNPLPIRVAITDKAVPGSPRFMATMSDWNTNPGLHAGVFTFVPPAGAQKVPFRQSQLKPAPAGRGPGK